MIVRTVVAVSCIGFALGCEYVPPTASGTEDATADADPRLCGMTSAFCIDDVTLGTCAGGDVMVTGTHCSWGCTDDGEARCAALVPTGGALRPEDVQPEALAGLQILSVPDGATLDTDTGEIGGAQLGVGEHWDRENVAVFRLSQLDLAGAVRVTGAKAVALVVNGPITVRGPIDVTGCTTIAKPGAGGFWGGVGRGANGQGIGGGTGGRSSDGGGGGGGHGGTGGASGQAETNAPAYGDPEVTMLVGGAGGGAGGGAVGPGSGGGGGGALQLISNDRITIEETGSINAGGCGGGGGQSKSGEGGGGGAGGTIVLEAPVIQIAGALAVNGGGGGGGGTVDTPGNGGHGKLTRIAAPGGFASFGGFGGDGGSGNKLDGGKAQVTGPAGGGGGAVGRIRVNTRTGAVDVHHGAQISPTFDDAPTTATRAAARLH